MAQDYPAIPDTTELDDSLALYLARDDAVRSSFSGTAFPADPVAGQLCWRTDLGLLFLWSGAAWRLVLLDPSQAPGGRLGLTSGAPEADADVTGATSLFCTPCRGEALPLYDGTRFAPATFTERTLNLTSNAGHTGYQQSGKIFDVFAFWDSGTLRIGTGPAWASDTARAVGAGPGLLNGIYCNTGGAINVRFGANSGDVVSVPQFRATWLGTIRASADGQVEDSEHQRFVWNTYNRRVRSLRRVDTTDTWSYSTATVRQARGDSANELRFVRGLDEDAMEAIAYGFAVNSTTSPRGVFTFIGLDSTTARAAGQINSRGVANSIAVAAGNVSVGAQARWVGHPGRGYHRLTWLELASGSDTQTWVGDNGSTEGTLSGISGWGMF